MLSLWQATLASMLAPGLALRGPAGSMEVAVNQLMEEYRGATRLFAISLFLFMLTAVLWCAGPRVRVPAIRAPPCQRPAPPAHAIALASSTRLRAVRARRSWTSNETVTSVLGTIAMLVIMRLIYGAAMRAFADFDFNPELTDEFDHKEVISGGWSAADPTPQLSADPLYTARRSRPELSRTDSAASVGSTFSDTDRLGSPSPAPWRRASFDQSSSWRRTSFDVSSPQPLAVKPGGTLFGKGALPTLSGRRGTGPAVTPPRGRGRRRWSQFGTAGWSLL